jgi:hypothetical protein
LKEKQRIPLVSTAHWQTAGGWHSGKTDALAKLALWQKWRSGKTGALAKLALWQNWRYGKTGAMANWRSGKTERAL